MQVSETDIIGAVKIKDGLFIGDEYAAQVHLQPKFSLLLLNSIQYRIWNL